MANYKYILWIREFSWSTSHAVFGRYAPKTVCGIVREGRRITARMRSKAKMCGRCRRILEKLYGDADIVRKRVG